MKQKRKFTQFRTVVFQKNSSALKTPSTRHGSAWIHFTKVVVGSVASLRDSPHLMNSSRAYNVPISLFSPHVLRWVRRHSHSTLRAKRQYSTIFPWVSFLLK